MVGYRKLLKYRLRQMCSIISSHIGYYVLSTNSLDRAMNNSIQFIYRLNYCLLHTVASSWLRSSVFIRCYYYHCYIYWLAKYASQIRPFMSNRVCKMLNILD